MAEWTPTRRSLDARQSLLRLSREESFVLASVDGMSSVSDLVDITGLAERDVELILDALATHGAIEPAPDRRTSIRAAELPPDSDDFAVPQSVIEVLDTPTGASSEGELPSDAMAPTLADDPGRQIAELDEERDAPASDAHSHRALYEAELHPLDVAARIATARACDEPTLTALCFDADVQVIRAVLDNDRTTTAHARLLAEHHANPVGLELVFARAAFLRDVQVQRRLLRNAHLTEAQLRRLLMPRRLVDIYKTSNDRDVPERTRTGAKALLKAKFAQAAPEEKFELVWTTEGRALAVLLGQPIDQKTAALLCARNVYPVSLIQSLARFPATPPSVLAHLLKQPLVKRQAHLRSMLLQHPNVPSEAKRRT